MLMDETVFKIVKYLLVFFVLYCLYVWKYRPDCQTESIFTYIGSYF